jgi:hypothetical protein
VYPEAVESAFGANIDYAMLIKVYGADRDESEARYSPAGYMGCRTIQMSGNPKAKDISTSFVERPEPDDVDADAPFHAADGRARKEDRQLGIRSCASFHALQFFAARTKHRA